MAVAMDWDTVRKDVEQKFRENPADDVKKRITIPNPVPCGNHLAHFIRSIHWNSKGMLPSTAGSKRSYDKYRTVTSLSFQGPDGFVIEPGEASGGFPRKKDTIEDIILTPRTQVGNYMFVDNKNQNCKKMSVYSDDIPIIEEFYMMRGLKSRERMFNRWKVPDRLVDSAPTPRRDLNTPAESEASVRPAVQQMPAKEMPAAPPTPAPIPAASRMSREMSLPNIKLKGTTSRLESRNGLQQTSARSCRSLKEAPVVGIKPPTLQQRSKTMFVDSKKASSLDKNGLPLDALVPEAVPQAQEWMKKAGDADKRVIERVLKIKTNNGLPLDALVPEAVPQAQEWMKKAGDADKRVIERVLKMASKKNQLETNLKRTLLPDAKESVEKWLGSANEEERQVALEFFNSLAGGQLMGMTVDSQRKRLKDVISTLEDAKPTAKLYTQAPRRKGGRNRKETVSDGHLKYIRLLTPNTRENRWMHTTWHHLPEYRNDDIVDNRSSHYIKPHQPISRHFVIHPDWG